VDGLRGGTGRTLRLVGLTLLIEGSRDQHTTLGETQALFASASAPKEWWVVEGAAHVDLHRFSGAVYERRIDELLSARLVTVADRAVPAAP
jgi:uncharacterized protein